MKEVLSRTLSTFLLLTIIWKEFKCAEIWTCKIEDSHHFSDSLPEDVCKPKLNDLVTFEKKKNAYKRSFIDYWYLV